ncbi:MAG: HNH endonuclease [Acidimicrobiales bacterium]|nr:HNH endonuclease [Acidimicrobiales bacterium]
MSRADRRSRLELILERDGPTCVWCGRTVAEGLVAATTEHVIPRVKGGPSWIENEVAACRRCNARRGHRTLTSWADECESNGWQPDRPRLVAVLEALHERIEVEGGQRRARPYLQSQLRRLRYSLDENRSPISGSDSCRYPDR